MAKSRESAATIIPCTTLHPGNHDLSDLVSLRSYLRQPQYKQDYQQDDHGYGQQVA